MLFEVAVITSFLFLVIVLVSLAVKPRLWIQDFPEAMQAEMAPLSRSERLARAFVALLLLGVVIGIPLLSVLRLKSMQGGISFLDGVLYFWLIFMTVNVVDLVIIDWVIGVWWQPDFLSTPEIDPLRQYSTYWFHVIEHLKGTVLLTVVALVLGALVSVG